MTVKELIDKLQQFDEGLGFVLQWAKYGLKK